ncbi:hypothetical protein EZS27_003258 [termite gut metagenome]|uniref:DUF4465 domain-containing protein n=1 Tax=termite gut metagenome TaxID=433724 RepID=A0A5J4STK5_9ZZZZ
MKKLHLLLVLVSLLIFCGCQKDDEKETIVITFEGMLNDEKHEFITSNGAKADDYYYQADFKEPLNILQFDHYYAPWGFGGGFTYVNYSNKVDLESSNLSAITGKGKSGSIYLTSNTGNPTRITNLKSDKYKFTGAWVTNSTFAYLVVKEGNAFARKFDTGDYFILTAKGYDHLKALIGKVEFYLADFRNGKSDVVNTWNWVNLTPLASAEYIEFEMSSTDNSGEYMNTPSYFCMDDVILIEN